MATRKRELQYVIDGYVNSRFHKSIQSASNIIARAQNRLRGMNTLQAQSAAASRRAASGFNTFGGGLLRTAIGLGAAYVGARQLVSAYKDVIGAANEQVRASTRLQQLMGNVPGTTRAAIADVQKYASALQKVTTIGDETSMAGASQLATYQLQSKNIRGLMPALADLAVGTYGVNVNQEQAIQSANLLGKVFTGQVGALRRVGVTFDKTQEKILKNGTQAQKTAMLIKVIQQNYGGLARKMAATPEGRVVQLRNAWGDVKEEIGMGLLPVQEKLLAFLSAKLPYIYALIARAKKQWAEWSPALKQIWDKAYRIGAIAIPILGGAMRSVWKISFAIGSFIAKHWSVLGPIIMGIVGALMAWSAAIKTLTIVQGILNVVMMANPIGIIIAAIGALIGLIYLLVKNWDAVKSAIGRAWQFFLQFGKFLPIIGPIIAAIGLIAKNWDKVVAVVRTVWGWISKVFNLIANNKLVRLAVSAAGKIAGRQAGGPVAAGSPYIVGERGPELFVPKLSGAIMPNLAMAGAGGGGITINMTVNASGSAEDIREGVRRGADDLVSRLRRLQRDEVRRSFDR